MSTRDLPLWMDREQFNAGLDRHPRLSKRLDDINEKIQRLEQEEEVDEDYYYSLIQERRETLDKIVD